MMIFVQIIDTSTGIFQHGVINEPIKKGFEVANAIGHFGVNINTIKWENDYVNGDIKTNPRIMSGYIEETTKLINVVII